MSYFKDYEHNRAPYKIRIVKFGCENCGRRWQSANGSLNDYQKCKNCYQKCYPSSYKIQAPNKRGNENRGTFQAHDIDLCGRCEKLGYSCMELGNSVDQDNLLVAGADDEDVVLTKSNDLSSYIVGPKVKKGKNKNKNISVEQSQANYMNVTNSSNIGNSNMEYRFSLLKIADTVYFDKNHFTLDLSKYNYWSDEQKMFEDSFYRNLVIEEAP